MSGMSMLFDRIADRYDRLNRVMSLGQDLRWRRRGIEMLAQRVNAEGELRILDVATGTGDVAIALARRFPKARIIGVDISEEMMTIGRAKIAAAGLSDRIELVSGDAMKLAFEDNSFDAVTCSFGVRNFPHIARGIKEFSRVVRRDGHVLVLEFFRPRNLLLGYAVAAWLTVVGTIFASSKRAEYRHLRQSILHTVSRDEFLQIAAAVGLNPILIRHFLPSCNCVCLQLDDRR